MFCGGNDEVLVRLMVLREIGLHADQPEWSPQALNAHFSFILFPFQLKTTAFRPAGAPNLSPTKEALIYSSMNRVASQIGKIATRTAQVVAGTTMPGHRPGHVGIDQRFPTTHYIFAHTMPPYPARLHNPDYRKAA